jgi:hypothetical protein
VPAGNMINNRAVPDLRNTQHSFAHSTPSGGSIVRTEIKDFNSSRAKSATQVLIIGAD